MRARSLSARGRRTKGREGEVECEHEARSLGLVAPRTRIQLPPSLPFVRRPRRLPKQGKSPTPTEMSYFSVMTPSSSIPTNNLLEYTCHAYFYYRPLILYFDFVCRLVLHFDLYYILHYYILRQCYYILR